MDSLEKNCGNLKKLAKHQNGVLKRTWAVSKKNMELLSYITLLWKDL